MNTNFAKNLRIRRKEAFLTQKELSDLCGFNGNEVSQYENGHREPSLGNLRRLCHALVCNSDELLFGKILDENEYIHSIRT